MGDTIKDDGSHKSWVAVVERAEAAECALSVRNAQIARLRVELEAARLDAMDARCRLAETLMERDARPEISREDAAACSIWGAPDTLTPYGIEETHRRAARAHAALRAHAARAGKDGE